MRTTHEQQAIIEHPGEHALVSAVAGSGKSTALTYRVQRLVQQGERHDKIMVVMFNRDARDDFQKRLERLLGAKHQVRVGTFHRIGNFIASQLTSHNMLPEGKLETSEYRHYQFARQFLEPIIKKKKNLPWKPTFGEFFRFVDLVKSQLKLSPLEVFDCNHFHNRYRWFITTYAQYEQRRLEEGQRFFADLIYDPMLALWQDEKLKAAVADQFHHIIVDEFQDINEVQYEMVRCLAGQTAKVMVVGDPDQCIYTWRGAKPAYINEIFARDFPNLQHYHLSYSFRYGSQVALAANHVIRHNQAGPAGADSQRMCIAHPNAPQTTVDLCVEKFNNSRVIEILQEWRDNGGSFKQAAVLLRSFGLSLPIEIALLEAGIPYTMAGGTRAFELPEIAALIAGLYIATDRLKHLSEHQRRKVIRPFLETSSMALDHEAVTELVNQIAKDPDCGDDYLASAAVNTHRVWSARKIEARTQLWRNLRSYADDPLKQTVHMLYDRLDMDAHIDFSARSPEAAEDLRRLFESFTTYIAHFDGGALDFVLHVEELLAAAPPSDGDDTLLITSVHRSKGREWDLVVLPSLYHGAFPHIPSGNKPWSMDEERRLFYVGITRAMKRCVLLCPDDSSLAHWLSNGRSGNPLVDKANTAQASAFLYESNLYLSQQGPSLLTSGSGLPDGIECVEVFNQYRDKMEQLNRAETIK